MWEYKISVFNWLYGWTSDQNSIENHLNRYGDAGWELVSQQRVTIVEVPITIKQNKEGAWCKRKEVIERYPLKEQGYGEQHQYKFFFKRAKK